MAKAPEKKHAAGLAPIRLEFITRGLNARAIVIQFAGQAGNKGQKIIAVFGTANLNAIELGQDLQLIPERPQIFKCRFRFSDQAVGPGETTADGLKIYVVLEQYASDAAKIPVVLAERGVFELHHVYGACVDLAMQQPIEIGVGELAHRVG